MVACLSPSDRYAEENVSTLNYAARASLISNVPTKNIDPRLMEIDEHKRRILDLEKELRSANQHIQFLTQISEEQARRIALLESQSQTSLEDSPKLPLIKKTDSVASTPGAAAHSNPPGIRTALSPVGQKGQPAATQQQ